MALIVGLALGAVSLIALGDGDDALGIFAADDLTRIVLGAAAVVLLLIALLPRGRSVDHDDRVPRHDAHLAERDERPGPPIGGDRERVPQHVDDAPGHRPVEDARSRDDRVREHA